jgi:aldehyde dehydrogenase (NAD+)
MDNLWRNYIDGQWREGGDGGWIEIDDPSSGEIFAHVARGTAGDIDLAVAAARRAVETGALRKMAPHERMRLMVRIGAELRKQAQRFVPIMVRQNGKTAQNAVAELEDAAAFFEYYGGLTGKQHGRQIPLGEGFLDYTQYVPYGVAAHIIPWNYPLELAGRDVAPALACANAVVIKSPELCPIMLCALAIPCDNAGLPNGYLNLVCGYGSEAGEALASHSDIDHITFTGSVATGRRVAINAAKRLIPSLLELGGKGAGIVFPDADLSATVDSAGLAAFNYAGQVCSSGSRLLVHG